MSTVDKVQSTRVDQFFTGAEARFDRWRTLLQQARAWDNVATRQQPGKEDSRLAMLAGLNELSNWEEFFAYPGSALVSLLKDRVTSGDSTGALRLSQMISMSLLTHSYRTNSSDWNADEEVSPSISGRVPAASDDATNHRPYFEVLFATPARSNTWPGLAQEFRKLRRRDDAFTYDPVFVNNVEDALLGDILNGGVESVVIDLGIPFEGTDENAVHRQLLKP